MHKLKRMNLDNNVHGPHCDMNIEQPGQRDVCRITPRSQIYDYAYSNNTNDIYIEVVDPQEQSESGMKDELT